MHLTAVPALSDNYIWLLENEDHDCLVVDPGEASPVLAIIENRQLQPVAILLTHHHSDHVDGVSALVERWPGIRVYGPAETKEKGATNIVKGKASFDVMDMTFTVLDTPGHTLGHISYFSSPYLFCGDTLFSGGCGRLFEGSAEQMYQSFQCINELPANTLVCCAHEYSLSNMKFAADIYPENNDIVARYHQVKHLRDKNIITLPTTLAMERKINVFMMTQDNDLIENLKINSADATPEHVFAVLRIEKNNF